MGRFTDDGLYEPDETDRDPADDADLEQNFRTDLRGEGDHDDRQ